MDHYFLGQAHFKKGVTAEHQRKARSHFDRSLALDPDNVGALVMRAWVDLTVAIHLRSEDRSERFRSAEADLSKALRLRPETADAHVALGLLRLHTNRARPGHRRMRARLGDRPQSPTRPRLDRRGKKSYRPIRRNRGACARGVADQSARPSGGNVVMIAACAKLLAGHDKEAVARLSRSIELDPNEPMRHFYLAAALAHLGRMEEAREAARVGLELNPRLHHRVGPRREAQRPSRLSREPRARARRHASGGGSGRMTAARRLAAILAVDVVGYSRLMG